MRLSCVYKAPASTAHRSFLKKDVQLLLLQQDTDYSLDLREMLAELLDDPVGRAIKQDRLLLYIASILTKRRLMKTTTKQYGTGFATWRK